MRIVVFGAAGGVGRAAVTSAAVRGHTVVAAARTVDGLDREGGVLPVALDVRDAEAVRRAVAGADAALWCVGVTKRSGPDVGRAALPGVTAALAEAGARRIVSISGAGADLPGDHKGFGARAVSTLLHRVARDLVEDKEGEHAALAGSGLDWTEIRAPRLVDRPGAGRYRLGDDAPGPAAKPVAKADAGLALVELTEGTDWLRRSPFLTAA